MSGGGQWVVEYCILYMSRWWSISGSGINKVATGVWQVVLCGLVGKAQQCSGFMHIQGVLRWSGMHGHLLQANSHMHWQSHRSVGQRPIKSIHSQSPCLYSLYQTSKACILSVSRSRFESGTHTAFNGLLWLVQRAFIQTPWKMTVGGGQAPAVIDNEAQYAAANSGYIVCIYLIDNAAI